MRDLLKFKSDRGDRLKKSSFSTSTSTSGQDTSYHAAEVGALGTGADGSESCYVDCGSRAIVLVEDRYDESNQTNIGSGEKTRMGGFVGLTVKLVVDVGGISGILLDARDRRMADS